MTVETWKQMTGQQSTWFDTWLGWLEPQVVKVSDLCAANPSDPGNPSLALLSDAISNPAIGVPELLNYALAKMQYFEFSQVCVCNVSGSSGLTCTDVPPYVGSSSGFSTGPHTLGVGFEPTGPYYLSKVAFDIGTGWVTSNELYLWDTVSHALLYHETIPNTWSAGHNVHTLATPQLLISGHSYILTIDYTGGNWLEYPTATAQTANPRMTPQFSAENPSAGTYPTDQFTTQWYAMYPILCDNSPTPVAQPAQPSNSIIPVPVACSTNGDICSILNQIQQQIQNNYALLTLFQRRSLPFAWIAGTPSAGLTGSGTITVQDIIGCTVSVTAHPAGWGFTADNPKRYIPSMGAIQASDGIVYDDWRQLHYLSELFSIPSWATKINYSLRTGITATITPLSPEP